MPSTIANHTIFITADGLKAYVEGRIERPIGGVYCRPIMKPIEYEPLPGMHVSLPSGDQRTYEMVGFDPDWNRPIFRER